MTSRLLFVLCALILSGACQSGGGDDPPTVVATPTTAAPSPTATPDPLGPPPVDAAAAVAGLERFFASQQPAGGCAEELKSAWGVLCLEGDVDGDGKTDHAYLVPIHPRASPAPAPALVFVRRASGTTFERFPADGEADASVLGLIAFSVADRNGDASAEVGYLRNSCTATACSSLVQIQSWDGTAWRDIGPGDDGVVAVTGIEFTGKGAQTRFSIRGGGLTAPGAGPTRAVATTYQFNAGRYRASARVPDRPEYLYHAILDADALFDAAKFSEAADAYRAAIADATLKDWRKETGRGDGRAELGGYALLRIAIATAAANGDPTAALDEAIQAGGEPVFVGAAEEFRRGFQDGTGVHAGCVAVTDYLTRTTSSGDNAAYVKALFDYGFANPGKTYRDICPL